MTIFGYDISHHQGVFDHARARVEGMRFAYMKVTEGATFRDDRWPTNRDAAHAAGLYLAGYHFLRSDSSPADQALNLSRHIGDPKIPVVVDCEPHNDSRPNATTVERFVIECRNLGLRCTLLYLPRWYWRELSSPPLDRLPPLIQSHYGEDNPVGAPAAIYPGDDSSRWAYDGHDVTMLQFGSRGRVAGHLIDVDAYRGNVADLAQWFLPPEEDDMEPRDLLNTVLNPWRPKEQQITLRRALLRTLNQQEALDDKMDAVVQKFEAGELTADQVADELAERLAQ